MGIILKPFAWLLLFFYDFFNSYGIALILFALVVKLILFPVSLKGKKSMIQMNMLSGKMQQLQKQYGKDRERYNLEVQRLYEREKVNPMGGCLWSMVPLFILLPLYYIIREPLINLMDVPKDMIDTVAAITDVANTGAYPQIAMAEALNLPGMLEQVKAALGDAGAKLFPLDFSFLGINLANVPKLKFWENGMGWSSVGLFLLPLVSTVVSFLSMKVSMSTNKMNNQQPQNDATERTNKTMMWTMPLMSLWIGFTVPAGLTIYWIAQYFVTMAQEVVCGKLLKKDYEAARIASEERERQEKEEEKRRKAEAAAERARRMEEEKKNRGKKKPAGQKKAEPDQPGVNKNDSREGIRAYARGRAYIPDRFGGVTPYVDPSQLIAAQAKAQADAKGKKKGKKTEEAPAPKAEEKPVETAEREVEQSVAPGEEQAVQESAAAPFVTEDSAETEEVEVEVEEVEVEIDEDDNKEGV